MIEGAFIARIDPSYIDAEGWRRGGGAPEGARLRVPNTNVALKVESNGADDRIVRPRTASHEVVVLGRVDGESFNQHLVYCERVVCLHHLFKSLTGLVAELRDREVDATEGESLADAVKEAVSVVGDWDTFTVHAA